MALFGPPSCTVADCRRTYKLSPQGEVVSPSKPARAHKCKLSVSDAQKAENILSLALVRAPSGLRINTSSKVGRAVLFRNNRIGRYDSLQHLALRRQQIDVRSIFIAHPEGPVLVEGQSLGVSRQMCVIDGGDRKLDLFDHLDGQGVKAGCWKAFPCVEQG